jgi:uncharacterized membrane protein YeaQ/YmgE (transglycosylase-associated protein family)
MEHGPVQLVQVARAMQWLGDGWLGWVVVGILAGIAVRLMTSSQRSVGLLAACALGMAGAALGWYGARWFGLALTGPGLRFLAAFAGSLLVSMAATAAARMLRRTPR